MTNEHRKSSHTTFNIHLHIAWITKYRYKILKQGTGHRVKEIIRRICVEEQVEILSGAISPAPGHLLVSIHPSHSFDGTEDSDSFRVITL
jgi:putative transposase